MPTTILHVSDTHLGKKQYRSETRLDDYADAFEEAITKAIELDVDAVLHTGDLFDAPNPNVPTVNRCLDILSNLNKAEIPFLGIVGNHERKRDQQWLDLADRFELVERLSTSPRYVGDGADTVAIYGIDAVRRPSWATKDFDLEPPQNGEFTLLAMHELLAPPVPGHMADYATEDVLDRLNLSIDGLALGDYHEPEIEQVNNTRVWYPGSTEKTARDESKDHHVNLLEIEDGELTISKHRLEEPREFVEIHINFSPSDGLQYAEQQIKRIDLSGYNGKPAVAIAILDGEQTGVTPRDVHGLLSKHGAEVTQVVDNRGLSDIDDIEIESVDTAEMESLLDEEIAELELSNPAAELEGLIRDLDISKSNIRTEGEKVLNEHLSDPDEFEDTESDTQ